MKIVLASEVYPPRSGGAGWSTRALALGLRDAGHDVAVLTTSPGPEDQDGLRVRRLRVRGRKRLAAPRAFAEALRGEGADVVHAQHSLAALGCLGRSQPRPVAVTVRDHWPVCFWSTRISQGALCPECGVGPMTRCVQGRISLPHPLPWAAIPYMQWDLKQKRAALARAGAILAVSDAVGSELVAAGFERVQVVPNMVNAAETLETSAPPASFPLPERFLLYVGKLEENKGVRALVPAVAASRTGLPLVVLGEGSLSHTLKFDAASMGVTVVLRGWAHREDVLRVMRRATALVFPSLWPEPLSRVILEGLALGTPVAAMETGGTREILTDGENGLLVSTVDALGPAVGRLVEDAGLRQRIVEGALRRAKDYAPETLVPRYENVYRSLT